nr:carbonic anhydrase family protein [uncultured Carboxylicivirga sp.]
MNNLMTQTKTSQLQISSAEALKMLMDGNRRFVENNVLNRDFLQQINETSDAQYPFAAIVSCIDSRIPTEIVFDQGIGDVFNVRIAGNIVNEDILGSLEFACKITGSKLIVVMGHTSCGAIKGACDDAQLGNLSVLLNKIKPVVDSIPTDLGVDRSSANSSFVDKVAEKNVSNTIENILSQSKVLNELYENGEIDIVGAMYDVKSGKVKFA